MSYLSRTLRNGKSLRFRQKSRTKIKRSQRQIKKNCNHTLSFLNSSTFNDCDMHEKSDNSNAKSAVVSNNDSNKDDFHTTVKIKQFSIILKDLFDDQNNNSIHSNLKENNQLKSQRKNNILIPMTDRDQSIVNQSTDVRITPEKLKQFQIQKRKALDQTLMEKHGCRKLPVVVLENITEKIQFFSKLGLKYCHKSSSIHHNVECFDKNQDKVCIM